MYNTDMPTRAELPSTKKLLRSTGIAIVTATALLVTVVLPSEYGIDPTGIGKALGLKAMGDIKTQLAAEAEADAQADALAAVRSAAPVAAPVPAAAAVATTAAAQAPVAEQAVAEPAAVDGIVTKEIAVVLPPGVGKEVKMDMLKGQTVSYAWQTDGGTVNHDTHGEPLTGPANAFHRYLKEANVTGNRGQLTAEFDGSHGWYWRNRGESNVRITLTVSGQFKNLKQKS